MLRRGDTLHQTSTEHEHRLAEQADQSQPQTFLETTPIGSRHGYFRMIRIDLGSLAQIDLGQGSVMRFIGSDAVLMLDLPWREKRPVANVRLVRLSDGQTLANQILKVACLRPVGKEANYKAFSHLHHLEQDIQISAQHEAIATGKEVTYPDPLGISDFNQDKLPPLALDASNFAVGDILRTSLVVNVTDGRIDLDIGPQLRVVTGCHS
jgi:hypothetical protein